MVRLRTPEFRGKVIGVILLAAEIFVIPGFGIAGVLGIVAILAGLVLSLVGAGDTSEVILKAAGRVVFSLLVALIASLVILRFLPRLPFGRRLILEAGLPSDLGYASAPDSDSRWRGKRGRASSPLRPAGIAEFEGERVDVVSEGELIDAGQIVEVTRVDGNRIVVRQVTNTSEKE